VIDRVASAEHSSFFGRIASDHPIEIFLGSGLLILAALSFYLQRSWLAHIYGSICVSMASPIATVWGPTRWITEAYTYATWLRYRTGFLFLMITAVLYSHTIYREIYPTRNPYEWQTGLMVFLLIAAILVQFVIVLTHRYSNQPYRDFSPGKLRNDWAKRHIAPED